MSFCEESKITQRSKVEKCRGILDYIKGEKRVGESFHDKVTALHEDYVSLAEFERQAGHKERTSQLK